MAELYDGRLKAPKDKDLMLWDTSSPSISSTVSSYSDTIDFGRDQVFANKPAIIEWKLSISASTISQISTGADYKCVPGFWIEDAADGSTFSAILFVPIPVNGLSIQVATFNAQALGLATCRRYIRAKWSHGLGAAAMLQMWARMGLTD